MHISLIGMSGSGKSKWSVKLSELGFKRFCCDDMITQKLVTELAGTDGTIMELGEWMGFPYEPQYEERESKYLKYEIEALSEIIESIEKKKHIEKNIVVDTTGSSIYAGEEILRRLCQCTTVIHLSTPPEVQELMLKSYLENQRPVLWRDFFKKQPNEKYEETLARCYPDFLSHREQLYKQCKDITVDYYTRNHPDFQIKDFLNIVNSMIK